MLEYLKFSYLGSNKKVNISAHIEDGELKVCYSSADFPEKESSCPVLDKGCKIWLQALEDIHPEKWRAKYEGESLSDGIKWAVDYKREGKRCRHIKGAGAYPEHWERFLELVYKLIPLTDSNRIDRAALIYTGKTDMGKFFGGNPSVETAPVNCREKLVIDRKSGKITYRRSITNELYVSREYSIKNAASSILDECKDCLIQFIKDNGADTGKSESAITVTLCFLKNSPVSRSCSYSRSSLPYGWKDAIELIYDVISLCKPAGELFDRNLYGRGVKSGERVFCKVELENSKETCYCLASDDTYNIGERVLVEVKSKNAPKAAVITDIEYLSESEAPFSDKMGVIVRKMLNDETFKFYCPFCVREIDMDECFEMSKSAADINFDTNIPDWVKEELLKKKEICMRCENRPDFGL